MHALFVIKMLAEAIRTAFVQKYSAKILAELLKQHVLYPSCKATGKSLLMLGTDNTLRAIQDVKMG